MGYIKLKRLKSVAYNALRGSIAWKGGYRIDPFEHYTPEEEIIIDLVTGEFTPERDGDDVEKYYSKVYEWFHDVLPKEGITIDVIDKAIIPQIPISPNKKMNITLAVLIGLGLGLGLCSLSSR